MRVQSRVGAGLLLGLWPIAAMAAGGPAERAKPQTALANPLQAQSLTKLFATNAHPLFVPSRHRPAPEPPPSPVVRLPAPPAPPPNVVLVGVLKSESGVQALLRLNATGKLISVRIGSEVEGWKVSAIGDRQLQLARDGRQTTVVLFKASVGAHKPEVATPVSYQPPEPNPPQMSEPNPASPPAARPLNRMPPRAQSGRW